MLINLVSLLSIKLFVCGLVWHLIADWLLQNDFLSRNKYSLKYRASYVHSGIHLAGLLLIFPWHAALVIAITHLLIDTRLPLAWWRGFFKQTRIGDVALHVAIWGDQTLHVVVIAVAALVAG
jgi:hypothetical protein